MGSQETNKISSLKHFNRQKAQQAANMEEPVWVFLSAAGWQTCWEASIELESEAGQGSTFTLFLPIEYNPAVTIKKEKQSSLKVSEYIFAESSDNSDDVAMQSVPTVKVPETTTWMY